MYVSALGLVLFQIEAERWPDACDKDKQPQRGLGEEARCAGTSSVTSSHLRARHNLTQHKKRSGAELKSR